NPMGLNPVGVNPSMKGVRITYGWWTSSAYSERRLGQILLGVGQPCTNFFNNIKTKPWREVKWQTCLVESRVLNGTTPVDCWYPRLHRHAVKVAKPWRMPGAEFQSRRMEMQSSCSRQTGIGSS